MGQRTTTDVAVILEHYNLAHYTDAVRSEGINTVQDLFDADRKLLASSVGMSEEEIAKIPDGKDSSAKPGTKRRDDSGSDSGTDCSSSSSSSSSELLRNGDEDV